MSVDPSSLLGIISPSQIPALKALILRGLKTGEDFFDATVQFKERSDVTGEYVAIGDPVDLITISFGLREVRN